MEFPGTGETTAPGSDDGADSEDDETGSAETTGADDTTGDSGDAETTSDGSDTTATDDGPACLDGDRLVISDIDATLTTSDLEWVQQMFDGSYDPAMRLGGPELIHGYYELGYDIVYLTARPGNQILPVTLETAAEATERWLEEHGFPLDPVRTRIILAPSILIGEATREYKAEALLDLLIEGFEIDYAYGNASTDIGAYEDAMIAKDATFIIGGNAGEGGTVAIHEDGWSEHATTHLPGVEMVCE